MIIYMVRDSGSDISIINTEIGDRLLNKGAIKLTTGVKVKVANGDKMLLEYSIVASCGENQSSQM